MRFSASDAAAAVGARLRGPDVEIDGVSFDTRETRPGQLFVPIVAERDGHDFIPAAYEAGAVAHLSSRPGSFAGGTSLDVVDTAAALLELAAWGRARSSSEVVGITGSVGKTSTKDLAAVACAAGRRTTANPRSFNNEQGMPVTILGAPDDTEVLLLEMGMRGFGQIARLCEVARPTVGVVTAVGYSHTELVGGIEGVAIAKRELVEALPSSGTAVLNADDPRVAMMASHTSATVISYGRRGVVRVVDLSLDERACARFRVESPWGSAEVRLAVPGEHMAMNAAAALAVAGTVGVDIEAAASALGDATISGMRMQRVELPSGAVVIDDAYNANPTSMVAALDALAATSGRRRVALLGEMGELDEVEAGHRQVADHAAGLGIELIAVDTVLYGVAPAIDPIAALGDLGQGDVVLVKASRAAGLERLVRALT